MGQAWDRQEDFRVIATIWTPPVIAALIVLTGHPYIHVIVWLTS